MAGACAIIVWGGSVSCVMFGTLKLLGKLRVSEEEERKGKIIPTSKQNFLLDFQTTFIKRVQYVEI
jgi:ammonia channel protein AmtB